ncbi:MAG: hypothetical protein HDS33_04365 [Bacteroides sp.]|nr:hypothetical protein [Bacteroides sp.]
MSLPRTYRTYFDPHCAEYKWVSAEQKLLEIGHAVMHGFDLHECVREILRSHSHVSEDNVHLGVCELISAATGNSSGLILLRRNNTLDVDIDLLIEYLMRRYRVRFAPDSGHYLADDTNKFCRQELDEINGWKVATGQVDWYNLYKFGNFVAFPGDAELIREYNLRAAGWNKGFVSYIVPEPWYGNPASAQVIILGDAPRYDDFVSRIANQALRDHRLTEEVAVRLFDDFGGWWLLGGGCFYDSTYNLHGFEPPVHPMDLYNSPTYRHWLDQFRRWASWFKMDDQTVVDNVAVINATAYLSIDDEPLAAGLLPSHYFLLHLVNYIFINNRETIFVIPSERLYAVWQKILGDSMNSILASNRVMILSKDNSRLDLSPRNLSDKEKDLLKRRISGK